MSACFHVKGVTCDNCATTQGIPRFVVTTGGTYIGSVDFDAALRQLEIERDEARKERDLYKTRLDHAEADAEQAVAILTAERDEARAELAFIKSEYEKANASDLTRDALALQNAALKAELEEVDAEVVKHKDDRLRMRVEMLRLQRKIEDAPCLVSREGEMTYECRTDNLCRVCRWRNEP